MGPRRFSDKDLARYRVEVGITAWGTKWWKSVGRRQGVWNSAETFDKNIIYFLTWEYAFNTNVSNVYISMDVVTWSNASQTWICKWITEGSCENADFESVGLGMGLKFNISHFLGEIETANG